MSRLERRKDILLKLVILGCTAGTLLAFSSGPPLAHTGAFGESTCIVCHSGNSLNSPGGSACAFLAPRTQVALGNACGPKLGLCCRFARLTPLTLE